MNHDHPMENIAYHAARLLILIRYCGSPRQKTIKVYPGIEGRTLLAKLDFFIRYPSYLKRAGIILGKKLSNVDLALATPDEISSVESHMVRYLYGPWDDIYYVTLAYLIGKSLIVVEKNNGVETFRITSTGWRLTDRLVENPMFSDLALRADTVYHLFNQYSGSRLKDFIYAHFPEVVNREIGETI